MTMDMEEAGGGQAQDRAFIVVVQERGRGMEGRISGLIMVLGTEVEIQGGRTMGGVNIDLIR